MRNLLILALISSPFITSCGNDVVENKEALNTEKYYMENAEERRTTLAACNEKIKVLAGEKENRKFMESTQGQNCATAQRAAEKAFFTIKKPDPNKKYTGF